MAKMAAAPRIQRDFARLISLIKSVALLRQYRRPKDSQGQIIALPEDYETVRALVNDMYVDSSSGATIEVRKLVEIVTSLDASRAEGERITNSLLAQKTGTNAKQVLRRARKAIQAGWLVNKEQRKSYPADYAPGEPMPEVEGLPILEHRDAGIVGRVGSEHANEFSCEKGRVGRLAPLTDDNIPPHHPTSPVQLSGTAEIRPPGGTGRLQDVNLTVEGLPSTFDMGGSAGSEHANEFSCEKNRVGRLAPLTDDNIPPHPPTSPVQLSGTAEIRPPSGTGRLQGSSTNGGSSVNENTEVDWREISLGMPTQDAVKLWQSAGAPLIHLGPGENCEDLKTLLSDHDISPKHIEAIRLWLVQQQKHAL
jgi:hypothetical protein